MHLFTNSYQYKLMVFCGMHSSCASLSRQRLFVVLPIQLYMEKCFGGESKQCLLGTMMETVAARSCSRWLYALKLRTNSSWPHDHNLDIILKTGLFILYSGGYGDVQCKPMLWCTVRFLHNKRIFMHGLKPLLVTVYSQRLSGMSLLATI